MSEENAATGSLIPAARPTNISKFLKQTQEEMETRHLRFPSVEQRIKLYMSNWYTPPCPGNTAALAQYMYVEEDNQPTDTTSSDILLREISYQRVGEERESPLRSFRVSDNVTLGQVFHLNRKTIEWCQGNAYCPDIIKYYVPAVDAIDAAFDPMALPVPTLVQFGDSSVARVPLKPTGAENFPRLPLNMKFRHRFEGDNEAIENMTSESCIEGPRPMYSSVHMTKETFQPIIWRLTSARHYGPIESPAFVDVPWREKRNKAVWRGALTGIFKDGLERSSVSKKKPLEVCQMINRCMIVLACENSTLVDARLTSSKRSRWVFPDNDIDGIPLYAEKMALGDLMKYKAIIMLEGNDISSGFKWALYSNSVVMAQTPRKTSWAMEELLEPWVHYVPINDDLSDVQEKMKWILDNDEEAEAIAHRGSLWVQDLLYHPNTKEEDAIIYKEMVRRYRAHFVETPDLLNLTLHSSSA